MKNITIVHFQEDVSDPTVGVSENKPALTEAEQAVQSKFFGPLTREKVEWHPARLLCVRFNVKAPYGDGSVVGVAPGYKCKLDLFAKVDQVKTVRDTTKPISQPKPISLNAPPTETDEEKAVGQVELVTTEEPQSVQGEQEEQFKKASSDLFKSIFLDDSSSEESDDESKAQSDSKSDKSASKSDKPPPKQATGLFANINFDRLSKKPTPPSSHTKSETVVKPEPKPVQALAPKRPSAADFLDEETTSSAYGPAKPEKPLFSLPKRRRGSGTDDEDMGQWAE